MTIPGAVHVGLALVIALWLFLAGAAASTAARLGASPMRWLVLGLVAGPFAWLAARHAGRACPHCRSQVHRHAAVCPHCRRPVSGTALDGYAPEITPETLLARGED